MPKNTSAFNNTIKDFGIKSSSFRDMISRIQNYMDGAHIKTHSLPEKKGKDNNQAFHFVGNPYNTPVHYLADSSSSSSVSISLSSTSITISSLLVSSSLSPAE